MFLFPRRRIGLALLGGFFLLSACQIQPAPPELRGPDPVKPSPLLAQVGASKLRAADVPFFAQACRQLYREAELPTPEGDDVSLAVELLSLAESVPTGEEESQALQDGRRRLLSGLYLQRLMESARLEQADDEKLRSLLEQQKEAYAIRGESEIYTPTRISFAVISIGANPDFLPPESQPPLLTPGQVDALAGEIRKELGDRVVDLDAFLAIGRRWSDKHPTVRVEGFDAAEMGAEEAPEGETTIQQAVRSLNGNGAISAVLRLPEGAVILRRGVRIPGRGESLDEARRDLQRMAKVEAQRRFYRLAMEVLKDRYQVQLFPSILGARELRRTGGP